MPPTKSKFLQLFERDLGRCVYCGLDLKADYDRFMMATEDHLVPGSKGGYSRAYIMQRRAERLKEFLQVTHPGLADYQ